MNNFARMFLVALFVSGCTIKPKLLPNEKFTATSDAQRAADIDGCLKLADTYAADAEEWQKLAGETAKSSVIGAGAGAVGGAIVGSAGRGTAVGAAGGAVVALLNGLWSLGEGDPTYRRFAEYCLTKKGYEIAGW